MGKKGDTGRTERNTGIRERTEVMEPHMWAVTFWNDDVTTMDFVVTVLRTVFLKSNDEAVEKMLEVHHKGSAVVGEYTFDIALTRTRTALRMARGAGFPLRITYQRL